MSEEELNGPATKGDIVRLESAIRDLSVAVGKVQGGASTTGTFITWIVALAALGVAWFKGGN